MNDDTDRRRFQDICERLGIGTNALARMAGVGRRTAQRWLRGDASPPAALLSIFEQLDAFREGGRDVGGA